MPADLTLLAGGLLALGVRTRSFDLNARWHGETFGASPWFGALRRSSTYLDGTVLGGVTAAWRVAAAALGERHDAQCSPRVLSLGGEDVEGQVSAAAAAGLDPLRNPALAVLRTAAEEVAASGAAVAAIALAHPEQRPQALALAACLRDAGFAGRRVLYGVFEDVLAPIDLADDLVGEPPHRVFGFADAVVIGDPVRALASLAAGRDDAPGLMTAVSTTVPKPGRDDVPLAASFDGIDPLDYPFPEPVVDLRLGRGCAWGRCAFCAIQAHEPGYRGGDVQTLAEAVRHARRTVGARLFRLRDDLLSPAQLASVGAALRDEARSGGPVAWTARARVTDDLTEAVLRDAAEGGLQEVWLGLESAVDRVRRRMGKGVSDATVEGVLAAAARAGVRVRLLCLAGFPGEKPEELAATVDFLEAHRDLWSSFSLTPFSLMRRSRMAADPGRFGVTVLPDPTRREDRFRHTLPFETADETSRCGAVAVEIARAARLAAERAAEAGPEPSHDVLAAWLRAGGG